MTFAVMRKGELMQKQKFDEIISYVNKKVSEMEIETKYKMELLGMVTALGYAHEKETHDKRTETHACDCVDRQAAIDAIEKMNIPEDMCVFEILSHIEVEIATLPSAQPERTCVNCGRTANNGGWYADGGTRCPIEEHYALPKDGYCHLWEKRNITDDDYPERQKNEQV